MRYSDFQDDPELTPKQTKLVSALSDDQVQNIDNAILSVADEQFRKIAYIVGTVMSDSHNRLIEIPDVFYSQRVKHLVAIGLLDVQGNLKNMRSCEVKHKISC